MRMQFQRLAFQRQQQLQQQGYRGKPAPRIQPPPQPQQAQAPPGLKPAMFRYVPAFSVENELAALSSIRTVVRQMMQRYPTTLEVCGCLLHYFVFPLVYDG